MQQVQMQLPRLTFLCKYIIIAYVGVFLANTILAQIAGINLLPYLALSLEGLLSGFVFQVFTFPFIDTALMSVLFNALIIWFLGSELEAKWGTTFFAKFSLVSTLGSGLFYILIAVIFGGKASFIHGLNGLNLAMILAYGIIYSERTMIFMFIFPMKARYFCAILAAIELYMAFFSAQAFAAWTHLSAMAIAFGYLKYASLAARGVTLSSLKAQHERNKVKSKLSLVKNEEKSDKPDPENPKYWQ